MSVPVSVILDRKGAAVFTISPAATLVDAARLLSDKGVGALVVSADGATVEGIISERDLVRRCAAAGPDCWEGPVSEAMTAVVTTCTPDMTDEELMATMTSQRIRHVPVVVDGRLGGIVSIGDVVKARLDELEVQREALEQYVTGTNG